MVQKHVLTPSWSVLVSFGVILNRFRRIKKFRVINHSKLPTGGHSVKIWLKSFCTRRVIGRYIFKNGSMTNHHWLRKFQMWSNFCPLVSVGPSHTESNQLKWWRHLERQCPSVRPSVNPDLSIRKCRVKFKRDIPSEDPKPDDMKITMKIQNLVKLNLRIW